MKTQQKDPPNILTNLFSATQEMQRLRDQGWHSVNLPVHVGVGEKWLSENITGGHWHISRHWVFEREEDAVLFALRWS